MEASVFVEDVSVAYQPSSQCRSTNVSATPVVSNVSFIGRAGEVTAIIGLGSSGKSSLLRAIAGLVPVDSGKIHICRSSSDAEGQQTHSLDTNSTEFPYIFCDGNDDHLLAHLTVRETLRSNASFIFADPEDAIARVEFIIARMRLSACADRLVGDETRKVLSTGERRRTALAVALLDPHRPLLLLDEPTLGVDATQSRELMELLRAIARQENRTVILTVNNPSSGVVSTVDRVVLLHRGRRVFEGSPETAVSFFGNVDEDIQNADAICATLLKLAQTDDDQPSSLDHSLDKSLEHSLETGKNTAPDTDEKPSSSLSLHKSASQQHRWDQEFENSAEGARVAKEMDDLRELIIPNARIIARRRASGRQCVRNVSVLTKRFFIDGFRGHRLVVPLLLSLLQAVLMGTVTFQYARRLPLDDGWTPTPMFQNFTSHFFNQYVINGAPTEAPASLRNLGFLDDFFGESSTSTEEPPTETLSSTTETPVSSLDTSTDSTTGPLPMFSPAVYPKHDFHRPELDILNYGVDANESFPIAEFAVFEGPPQIAWEDWRERYPGYYIDVGRRMLRCIHKFYNLTSDLGYVDFDETNNSDYDAIDKKAASSSSTALFSFGDDTEELENKRLEFLSSESRASVEREPLRRHSSSLDAMTSSSSDVKEQLAGIVKDIIRGVQFVDAIWNQVDWKRFEAKCGVPNLGTESKQFYLCAMGQVGGLLKRLVGCHGDIPRLPLQALAKGPFFLPVETESSSTPAPLRRINRWKRHQQVPSTRSTPLVESADKGAEMFSSIYDQPLMQWTPDDVAARDWREFRKTTDVLVPGLTIWETGLRMICGRREFCGFPELYKIVFLGKPRPSLDTIDSTDFSGTALKLYDIITEVYNWLDEDGEDLSKSVSENGNVQKVESNASGCIGEGCREIKENILNIYHNSIRPTLNKAKINIIQRQLPRMFNSLWQSLLMTGALFAVACALGFFCFDALLGFHAHRLLCRRETAAGFYRRTDFFVAKSLADVCFQILPACLLAVIWGLCIGVADGVAGFFVYLVTVALLCFAAYGFCYMISAATKRTEVALVVAPLILMSWVILAGFILRSDEVIPVTLRWFRYISPHRYGWHALMKNRFPLEDGQSWGEMPNKFAMYLMGITSKESILTMCVYLGVLGIVFRLLAYLAFLVV